MRLRLVCAASPVDETTQPYYPNTEDVLADAAPHLGILEVPKAFPRGS